MGNSTAQPLSPVLMLIAACAVALAGAAGASVAAKGIANLAHFNAANGAAK